MTKRLAVVIGALALALTAAACGDDDGSEAGDDGADTTTTAAETTTTTTAADSGPATVATASTDLGEVLVDAEGLTLYLFTNDQGTTTSASEDVQQAWPPLTVESEDGLVAGEGVDDALLTTAEQADGRLWVAYNGHLLYRFSGDSAPGDTAGQGVGGVWFAVTPAGEQAG
jgi:predicted lipoprotein with Yx(FWY)xxD motif